ncbi:MAG: DUF4232 domain-containing protein, partial [Gaiellales bacterium]
LVQKDVALPASNPRANLHVLYRAYADVNGDGRRDLVTLRHVSASKGQLTVALAVGPRLSVSTPSDASWLPGLVATGNVDGRPGEELFVDVAHVTTAESISIYTYWQGALVKAGTLSAHGYDYGILYGLTCSAQGTRHLITQHDFYMKFGTHQWMRQDTVYLWQGPRLKLLARYAATRIPGQPSPALVGVQCGHVPRTAPNPDPPAPGPGLASVSFVSSGTAFVLGSAPCAHAPCTIVLRTLDRGRSWSRLSAPPEAISVPDGKGLWRLRFADARHGYAYGAGLWRTSNGAGSWQPMKAPGRTVLAFAAVQGRELVAIMTVCRSVGCAKGVVLYHRPISAGSWRRFAVNTSRGTGFDDAIAVHGNVVWVLAGYDLYVSTDGGVSFRSHSQPCHPASVGIPCPGGISDDGPHTYLLCLGSGYTGGVQKYLYRTTGTASGWHEVGQPPSPGGPDGFAAGSDRAIVIAAVSGASWLYRSDGGRRWRTALNYGDGGAGWSDLAFTSALDGAVIHAPAPLSSTSQLLLTGDGGRTWHAAALPAPASAAQAPRVSRPCAVSALGATFTRGSPYAGQVGYYLTITNRSTATQCTLSGPPSLTLLGRHGKVLPTSAQAFPPGRYAIVLKPRQWAQAIVTFASHAVLGEAVTACEPIAHSLAISISGRRLIAPMDPVRVCDYGRLNLQRLKPVPLVPACAASQFSATFKGPTRLANPAGYLLRLHNNSVGACYTSTIVSLALVGKRRQRLPTKVSHGVASPYMIVGHAEAFVQALFITKPGPGEPTRGRCEAEAFTARISLHPDGTLLVPIKPPFSACDHGAVRLMHMTPP